MSDTPFPPTTADLDQRDRCGSPRAPEASALLAAIRQATGIPASEQPDLVEAVRGIASQMDRYRSELKDQGENLAAIAFERDEAQARIRGANANLLVVMDKLDTAEGKLADVAALLRVGRIMRDLPDACTFPEALASVLAR